MANSIPTRHNRPKQTFQNHYDQQPNSSHYATSDARARGRSCHAIPYSTPFLNAAAPAAAAASTAAASTVASAAATSATSAAAPVRAVKIYARLIERVFDTRSRSCASQHSRKGPPGSAS